MKLIPYAGFDPSEHHIDVEFDLPRIWRLREAGMTWRAIASLLSEEDGCDYDHARVYSAAMRGRE